LILWNVTFLCVTFLSLLFGWGIFKGLLICFFWCEKLPSLEFFEFVFEFIGNLTLTFLPRIDKELSNPHKYPPSQLIIIPFFIMLLNVFTYFQKLLKSQLLPQLFSKSDVLLTVQLWLVSIEKSFKSLTLKFSIFLKLLKLFNLLMKGRFLILLLLLTLKYLWFFLTSKLSKYRVLILLLKKLFLKFFKSFSVTVDFKLNIWIHLT